MTTPIRLDRGRGVAFAGGSNRLTTCYAIPMKRPRGPIPTLGDLQRSSTKWVWLICEKCQHHAPFACAVAVIRWGLNTSSNKLRQCARCTVCGHKGATLQHPSWAGEAIGFQPFPVSRAVENWDKK
jgi:hypothetical protein